MYTCRLAPPKRLSRVLAWGNTTYLSTQRSALCNYGASCLLHVSMLRAESYPVVCPIQLSITSAGHSSYDMHMHICTRCRTVLDRQKQGGVRFSRSCSCINVFTPSSCGGKVSGSVLDVCSYRCVVLFTQSCFFLFKSEEEAIRTLQIDYSDVVDYRGTIIALCCSCMHSYGRHHLDPINMFRPSRVLPSLRMQSIP